MSRKNPYRTFVARQAALLREGAALPHGGLSPLDRPKPATQARRALIFSPHPDDECIIGGLPLRLMCECGMRVINVAVTLGRRPERQAARWRELERACAYLGFDLLRTAENGLQAIDPQAQNCQSETWSAAVAAIAAILESEEPDIIFLPHDDDWHPAHIGTHRLVLDALAGLSGDFACDVFETEFWSAMAAPNLMIGLSPNDVADLVAALSFHVGEITRNPYHLRLPAWMIDNVRRGSELIQGRGGTAPDMTFATLYRRRRWLAGGFAAPTPTGRILTTDEDAGSLFA